MAGFSAPQFNGQPVLERLLLFGPAKAGKSRAILSIARMCFMTGSDAKFYIINTEGGYRKMIVHSFPELASSGNIEMFDVTEWDDVVAAKKEIFEQRQPRPHDWVVHDLGSQYWPLVQGAYVSKMFDKKGIDGLGDFFLHVRENPKADLEGWTDWKVINRMYDQIFIPMTVRAPCHVATICADAPIREASKSGGVAGDSAEIRQLFGKVGAKPAGQKLISYQHDSIVYFEAKPDGNGMRHIMSVIGDREREPKFGIPVGEFAVTYMTEIAGWRVEG